MGGKTGSKPAAGTPLLLAVLLLALTVTCAAFPAAPARAAVVDPAQNNIPNGWPWKIKYLAYPTLGYPQIIKGGEEFTLEFDCIGKGAGGPQPDVSSWQVRLVSSNDRWPTVVDCQVQGAVRAVSSRWFQGSLAQTEANGEWAGPWSGDEVWQVTVAVPAGSRSDLYDLKVAAAGAVAVMDTQPHAVQVVEEYKDDYDFIQVSDFHINDPRGPSDSFIPGKYPDPDEFKDYLYNRKVIDDINLINPDFVVMTGDLPFGYPAWAHIFCPLLYPADKRTDYSGQAPGWDGEYNAAYEQLLRLEVPVVCMPGNHDSYNLQSQLGGVLPHTHGFAQDGAHLWPTMIGPRYFGWDYGSECHISCMNGYDKIQRDTDVLVLKQRSFIPVVHTPPADGGAGWIRPNQKEWLLGDLAGATGNYDLLAMAVHQPFYGKSSWDTWDSQAIMDELMQMTQDYDVDVVVSGHTHRDDVYVDNTDPSQPVTHLNTTTTSFGTKEYPGFRRIFVEDGSLDNYNYKPGIYSYPTYKDTQIKIHSKASEAEKALQHLDTPAVVGEFNSTDPNSVDKSFQVTNYFTAGSPPVVLDDTTVDFIMADIGDVGRYHVSGGTLLESWNPTGDNVTLRVKVDDVPPGGTVVTRVRRLYIASASPASAQEGETVDVDITAYGTAFQPGVSQAVFSGTGITVNSTTVHDSGHATANITVDASAPPGARDVNVITGGETPQPLAGGLTVHESPSQPPFIHTMTPTAGPVGTEVLLIGGNFGAYRGSSQVTFNGVPASSYLYWSDGEILCRAPFGAVTGPVQVVTPWGSSGVVDFEVTNFVFYFAEGTCRPNFDPYICIMNPDDADAAVKLTYMMGDGSTQEQNLMVPAHSRSTVIVKNVLGEGDDVAHDFSARVECTNGLEIVAERPMYFNYNGVWTGGHDVVGALSPSGDFYFAEGTCRPGFDPYICVQNPGDGEADIKITYMKGDGSVQEQYFTVPGTTRYTINVKDFLGEGNDVAHDFSARVECTNGRHVVAERPMYFDYNGVWTGGSDVVGAFSPAEDFYFAEGTCRPDFTPYICIQNPSAVDAQVRMTYMRGDGTTVQQELEVPASSRTTVAVKGVLGEGDTLSDDFSTRVECTNGVDIVAERPMYFDYHGWCTGGHDVVGALAPADYFYFAEGTCRTGFETYLCIQNPELAPARVRITYMKGDGGEQEQVLTVAPTSRVTVTVSDVLGTGDDVAHDFSSRVESLNGIPIVVERPMYFLYQGVWTGGHDVVGF